MESVSEEFIRQWALQMQHQAYSGTVKNCYLRFYITGSAGMLEIYSPGLDGPNKEFLKNILQQEIIEKYLWVDHGAVIQFQPGSMPGWEIFMTQLINSITSYFEKKYPSGKILKKVKYSSGYLTDTESLHTNDHIIIKYCEQLRQDFTNNYIRVHCSSSKNEFPEIFINTYQYGTLEYKNGFTEMHRWESEDETQAVSYWSRTYPARIADGVMDDPEMKQHILKSIDESINSKNIDEDDLIIIKNALAFLRK